MRSKEGFIKPGGEMIERKGPFNAFDECLSQQGAPSDEMHSVKRWGGGGSKKSIDRGLIDRGWGARTVTHEEGASKKREFDYRSPGTAEEKKRGSEVASG